MKNLQSFIGKTGVAVTNLCCQGFVEIDNERFVARSRVWIEVGTQVIVSRIELNQLIVKPVH